MSKDTPYDLGIISSALSFACSSAFASIGCTKLPCLTFV